MATLTISRYIANFKASGNPVDLLKALFYVVKNRRTLELLHGVSCSFSSAPSVVRAEETVALQTIVEAFRSWRFGDVLFSRQKLLDRYGKDFDLQSLPHDFAGARSESILPLKDCLIIGEYTSALSHGTCRLVCATGTHCSVNNYYRDVYGMRHIHAVHELGDSEEILITTGDHLKFLDRWRRDGGELVFVKRMEKRLAGYTAVARVNGDVFFGTDFSSRPNYIRDLNGRKYFFPAPAYRKFTVAFRVFSDRYIAAVNSDLPEFGGGLALSVFDAAKKEFVYSEYLNGS